MDARLYSWETDEVSSSKLWPRRGLDLCLSFPTIFLTNNLISICQGEKLWEVEDDRHEEEGEGVAKSRLRTQAELKTVNRFLKSKTIYPPVLVRWILYLRRVERWAGERLLACDTLLDALLDIRPGWWWYDLKYCLHSKRVWVITYYCTGSNTR